MRKSYVYALVAEYHGIPCPSQAQTCFKVQSDCHSCWLLKGLWTFFGRVNGCMCLWDPTFGLIAIPCPLQRFKSDCKQSKPNRKQVTHPARIRLHKVLLKFIPRLCFAGCSVWPDRGARPLATL